MPSLTAWVRAMGMWQVEQASSMAPFKAGNPAISEAVLARK
jgi:hypothetical protein